MSTGNKTCTCTKHTATQCSQNLAQLARFLRLAEPVRQVVSDSTACKASAYKSCSTSCASASPLSSSIESFFYVFPRVLLGVRLLNESVCL